MYLTWLDSNSWLIEMGETRILLDPWLVDSLVFGNAPWFFKAERNLQRQIPENIDLILLSQGLEDHAHPPTLAKLDRNIPVVASPNAAKVVQKLGYTKVTTLAHGETFSFSHQLGANQLEIRAFPGSPIGPMLVENGYLLKDLTTNKTLYYEPHGYHSPTLKQFAPVDVVITPIVNLDIVFVGSFIKGMNNALEVIEWLKPRIIMNTAAGGDISFSGLLVSALRGSGSVEDFRNLIAEKKLPTKVVEPQPWERFEVDLALV
ncbi:MBL fold metallo-hydrolase [Calothrix sp. UHCC 0171]|uniref:MBL fold metallo-hydrolase n=1 Tax=Calothrix sp. UHCC 0171 TaxID=3110245 RepID=UPI002B1F515B|nr:MBL fold metallo-hydrolase [Calothrix sp. UHCC 0171]MEA5571095.1 MBL fold metallo-hydrolase [Calothrix sp. UHCC 0171]